MVYVDAVQTCLRNDRWPWRSVSHLFADTLAELHATASRVGLRLEWFQDRPGFPHYDLTPSKRELAIKLGARELSNLETMQWRRRKFGERALAMKAAGPRF